MKSEDGKELFGQTFRQMQPVTRGAGGHGIDFKGSLAEKVDKV